MFIGDITTWRKRVGNSRFSSLFLTLGQKKAGGNSGFSLFCCANVITLQRFRRA